MTTGVDRRRIGGYAPCVMDVGVVGRWTRLRQAAALVFALAAVLRTTANAASSGLRVEPGLWVISWSIPDPLGGEAMSRIERTCVREREITAERVNAKMTACRISSPSVSGSTARWKMRCDTPAGPMSGSGSLRSTPLQVAGTVEMSMSLGALELPVTGTFKGRRVADCR